MTDARPVLLVVEDDTGLAAQLRWAFEDYAVVVAGDRTAALTALRRDTPAVVTLDLGLPPDPDGTAEGFAVLDAIMTLKPDTKVIVASGHDARESALEAIARGAYDFYAKPVDIDALALIVARAFNLHRIEGENRRLASRGSEGATVLGTLLTADPEMVRIARTIERVASTGIPVMLLGASGTGKSMLARGLHRASARAGGPFVSVNCAAIPETLLDAELFGRDDGADAKPGRVQEAHGGTLFLDEIGELPLAAQTRLLRLIEDGAVEGPGGRSVAVDTRFVCTTHRDLDAMIADGGFRDDLYFRLAEIAVRIPALADRPGDAALLARAFLQRFAAEYHPKIIGFAPDALAAIDRWPWPGNVRELENRVKRGVIMAEGRLVGAADLDLPDPGAGGDAVLNLKAAREAADRRVIRHALSQTDGNISGSARLLGISRPTLYDLLKQYDLQG